MKTRVIAVDGPAYVGKSQIAKALAERTRFAFFNTGHMYRAAAKIALENGLSVEPDNTRLLKAIKNIQFQFLAGRTMINGEDWTERLDRADIVAHASKIAILPEIRILFTEMQREYAKREMIIMEGRDIGSVVFPDAQWKFFVTASEEVRAKRMFKMLSSAEKTVYRSHEDCLVRVREIDRSDRNRKIAPLVEPEECVIYDNSESPNAVQDAEVLYDYMKHQKHHPKLMVLRKG